MGGKIPKSVKIERAIFLAKNTNLSANQIQKQLQKEGYGFKRQELLDVVRKARGLEKKKEIVKHIPKKYRKVRQIEIVGNFKRKERRIIVKYTSKRELRDVFKKVMVNPPKEKRISVYSSELVRYPSKYLLIQYRWDSRPKITY